MIEALKSFKDISRKEISDYYSKKYSVKGLEPNIKNILGEEAEKFLGVSAFTKQILRVIRIQVQCFLSEGSITTYI